MFRLRCAASLRASFCSAARLGVIGVTFVAAGCASSHTSPPSQVAASPPHQTAGAWQVEIEEDGLPAQLAPRHPRPVIDDPSQPWSPNYGKGAPAPAPATSPGQRRSAPPQETAPARVTGIDEEAIIRRAIAEHEMRRRD